MKRREALAVLGAVAAAPAMHARAQQARRSHRVALFLPGTEDAMRRQRAAIVARLATHGFVEGRNLVIESRMASFVRVNDGPSARALVEWKPDAIVVDTTPLAEHVRDATATIPIVFAGVADPVALGLVKSFAKPGGNATGVYFSQAELAGKRLELLRELLPQARRVMVARDLAGPDMDTLPLLRTVAARLDIEIVEVFVNWVQGFSGTMLTSAHGRADAIMSDQRWVVFGVDYIGDQIVRFAAQERIPSIFWEAAMVERGATLAYGVDPNKELVRAADQLARVLKGAKPADLPVDVSTDYDLVIGSKSVRALKLTIPNAILARARVVE